MNTPGIWSLSAFRLFWSTRVFTILALQMLLVGLGWQMYSLKHHAMDLALLGLASYLPLVGLVLFAGQAADHFNRKALAMTCQVLEALVALTLAILAYHDLLDRTRILALVVLLGSAKAFEAPTLASLLPALAPKALLQPAVSAYSAAMQLAVIGGSVLGGILYLITPWALYGTAAVLSLSAMLSLSFVQMPALTGTPDRTAAQPLQFLGGLAFIFQNRRLLGVQSLDLFAVLLGGATALLPMYALDILHTHPWGLGLLRASPAVGALITAFFLQQRSIRLKTQIMFTAVAGFGLFTVLFGLSTQLWLSCLALAAAGASDMISVVIRSTLVQMETTVSLRGRVNAINMLFTGTSNQLGEVESGLTAAWLGAVPAVILGGIGSLLIAALWWYWFPQLRTDPTEHLDHTP